MSNMAETPDPTQERTDPTLGLMRYTDEDAVTAVHLALGAASMCWETVTQAGVFQSVTAQQIATDLVEHLRRLRLIPETSIESALADLRAENERLRIEAVLTLGHLQDAREDLAAVQAEVIRAALAGPNPGPTPTPAERALAAVRDFADTLAFHAGRKIPADEVTAKLYALTEDTQPEDRVVSAIEDLLASPKVARCNGLQPRATWDANSVGHLCLMTQPDGSQCPGTFEATSA